MNSQMPMSRNPWLVPISFFCANCVSLFISDLTYATLSIWESEAETGTAWTCGSSVAFPSASLSGCYSFRQSVLFRMLSILMDSLADISPSSCAAVWIVDCLFINMRLCSNSTISKSSFLLHLLCLLCVHCFKIRHFWGGIWGVKGNKPL